MYAVKSLRRRGRLEPLRAEPALVGVIVGGFAKVILKHTNFQVPPPWTGIILEVQIVTIELRTGILVKNSKDDMVDVKLQAR